MEIWMRIFIEHISDFLLPVEQVITSWETWADKP